MPRADVIEALETLSNRANHTKWAKGERTSPGLNDAIHWLIDDTWLDERPATSAEDDRRLFTSNEEARLVQDAVDMLCRLIEELGDVAAGHYVHHRDWDSLSGVCARAYAAMTSDS